MVHLERRTGGYSVADAGERDEGFASEERAWRLSAVPKGTNEGGEETMGSDDGSDSDGNAREEEEEEYVDDVEDERCADLMDPEGRTHQGATATLTHARETYGVDIRRYVTADAASPMRFYEGMKVLNYIRFEVGNLRREGMSDCGEIAAKVKAGCEARAFDDERFMTPTLQDDALLFGWEGYVDGMDDDSAVDLDGDDEGKAEEPNVIEKMQKLKLENEELRLRLFETMAAAGLVDDSEVTKTFSPTIVQGTGDMACERIEEQNPSKGESDERVAVSRRSSPQTTEEKLIQEVDDGYFDSYSYFDIHRDMIGDSARTEAYRDALELNPSLIKGKKVLDVGCGTGILSMFAARGGADKVVGVDGSKRIAEVARKNAQHNGFGSEGTDQIQIVQGKLEDIEGTIPNAPFDVLVSEWMGYGLLFESMLDTVLVARDRYLKPGGAVLPDIATIHIAGFDRAATSFPFWDDVYNFQMPEVARQLHEGALKTAVVTHCEGKHLTTDSIQVCELDLATCSIADTEFTTEFTLTPQAGREGEETHGVVLWFDTEFSKRFCAEHPVMLSTHPNALKTHWVQTMLHFSEALKLVAGSKITGRISMVKSKRPRSYDISLEYQFNSDPSKVMLYAL